MMQKLNPTFGYLFKGILALSIAGAPVAYGQESDEKIHELSPFTVSAGEDVGYRATTTLAGSRLKTSLRDVGSAISVLTEEFFDDTGAVDAESVLSYAMNTDVSGVQGNFANSSSDRRTPETTDLRSSPETNGQRVRGLANATLTRDYFTTDIAFDKYNTERVTINRGPNSLLFGVGSPGGIIDNSLKKATLSENFGEVSVRIGERGSHRETIDLNRVLVEGRLALRIAGLNEELNYQQRPAMKETERFYANFQALLFKNENSGFLGETRLSGHYENGSTFGHPPNVLPPADMISDWFETPDRASLEKVLGPLRDSDTVNWIDNGAHSPKQTFGYGVNPSSNLTPLNSAFDRFSLYYGGPNVEGPGINGVDGLPGWILWSANSEGFGQPRLPRVEHRGSGQFVGGNDTLPFVRGVIQNRNVFDNHNVMLGGTTNIRSTDFDGHNLSLQQSFFDGKGGLEIAFDEQSFHNEYSLPFSNRNSQLISIDINERTVKDEPNPFLGLPFARDESRFDDRWSEREALRATAFYELNFTDNERLSWLGKHVFTGFLSEQKQNTRRLSRQLFWDDASSATDAQAYHGQPNTGFRRRVVATHYLGNRSLLDPSVASLDDVRIKNYVGNTLPKVGDVYTISHPVAIRNSPRASATELFVTNDYMVNDTVAGQGQGASLEEITSDVLSLQSSFFGGNLVALYGIRNDEVNNRESDSSVKTYMLGEPFDPVKDETTTWSVVAHQPAGIKLPFGTEFSLHMNESEIFEPVGLRRNVYGDVLAPPSANTEEIGFTIEMFERSLVLRVNWYELASKGATADIATGNLVGGRLANTLNRWLQGEATETSFEDAIAVTATEPGVATFNSYQEVYDAIYASVPESVRGIIDLDGVVVGSNNLPSRPTGIVGTNDFVAKGVEIDLSGQITPNWQVTVNVAQQETVRNNVIPEMQRLSNEIIEAHKASGLWLLRDAPTEPGGGSVVRDRWNATTQNAIVALAVQEGTQSQEQREWRINAVTNYRFDEDSFLKGFAVGGAWRWQDEVAAGYEIDFNDEGIAIPQLERAFMGPSEESFDLWLNYNRKIGGNKKWKVQLNVRNVFADDEYIPILHNPDGSVAVVRNPNPRDIFLTNTISF